MTTPIIISLIGLFVSIITSASAIYFSSRNSKKTDIKEIETRVANDTKINIKLDSIAKTMDEIVKELSSAYKELSAHNDRLLCIEQHIKSLEQRMVRLEKESDNKKE